MLSDAALCAETLGTSQHDLTISPGWIWVRQMFEQAGHGARKKLDADKLIDAVADTLELDRRALAACRARLASTTLDWIATARRSGVPRNRGAIVVIGGRIYEGLTERPLIHALIEAELAPGVLGSLPRWDAPPEPAPAQRTK
jgi:hypothetical protein